MLIGKGQLFLERGKGTIAQSGNWTLKASRAIFNTVGGLRETRAEGDGHAAALQGRDTCGAGAPAVPGPGSVGRHGAPRPLCRCPLGARWAQAARAPRHAQREGLALPPLWWLLGFVFSGHC